MYLRKLMSKIYKALHECTAKKCTLSYVTWCIGGQKTKDFKNVKFINTNFVHLMEITT